MQDEAAGTRDFAQQNIDRIRRITRRSEAQLGALEQRVDSGLGEVRTTARQTQVMALRRRIPSPHGAISRDLSPRAPRCRALCTRTF